MQTKTSYSGLQIALHWAIALLIGANYLISEGMGRFLDKHLEGEAVSGLTPNFHVYAGVAVLVLALVRLVLRATTGAPAPISEGSVMDLAAVWAHRALYVLMILVPALGASAWYLGIEEAGDLHELTMNIMMIIAGVHALGALFHQFVLKDGLLRRMTP